MSDFTARFTSGPHLAEWNDPMYTGKPSRVNPVRGLPLKRPVVLRNTTVTVKATPDSTGVEGDVDANLGGRLFYSDFIEYPDAKPVVSSPVGNSAVMTFAPTSMGHYIFQVIRPEGGCVLLHLDVTEI